MAARICFTFEGDGTRLVSDAELGLQQKSGFANWDFDPDLDVDLDDMVLCNRLE